MKHVQYHTIPYHTIPYHKANVVIYNILYCYSIIYYNYHVLYRDLAFAFIIFWARPSSGPFSIEGPGSPKQRDAPES